ncbi:conserved hypothetical protein [Formosa agariphila KMM 3901]|uniref:FrrB n=1 Tax=Formosa agariphila (strain DSM 15362 / KCTC 12365 / LMG 23005 / KMM 3901 / M-2Alg 35-1) TaxID=1347342 RepID=T2KMY0_FORAG|nr:hypothetical protein [Formosa agariphila]CDF80115.1 conserved hypothetical protein [Formosa agariphila KMM 3901]
MKTKDNQTQNQSVFSLKNTKYLENQKRRLYCMSLLILLVLFNFGETSAQEDGVEDAYKPFSIGAHLKNMHLWHGSVVHPGAVIATDLEYNSRNQKFTFGFWGGASFSGRDVFNEATNEYVSAYYKEFSIYTSYRISDKFFIEAVSHNNYTGVEERGDELQYWSYDKTQGYNFVDVSFGYNVTPNTLLYLATIIGGGSGDYQIEADGSLKNSWTQYFEINSKVWKNENSNLSVFVGGAWSFFTDKTFYTEGAGNVVNVGATFNRDFNVINYKVPVAVTAMWNPEAQKTVLQLDIALF